MSFQEPFLCGPMMMPPYSGWARPDFIYEVTRFQYGSLEEAWKCKDGRAVIRRFDLWTVEARRGGPDCDLEYFPTPTVPRAAPSILGTTHRPYRASGFTSEEY